ncbi:MAG: hypothetical protein NVSMB9_21770 [Isosphaeraceae bacterium]
MKESIIPPLENDQLQPIADAAALFQESPANSQEPSTPPTKALPTNQGGYEVAVRSEIPSTLEAPDPFSREGVDAQTGRTPPPEKPPRRSESRFLPEAAVSQPWSRAAEWGNSLWQVAIAAGSMLCVVYFLLSGEYYWIAFWTLILGSALVLVLIYPMLITLERPVRITPEQAIQDYFSAISHHRPHYLRMWLLLSNKGRVSSEYASIEGFSTYWKKTLLELRGRRVTAFTPLKFVVNGFKSEKSVGKTEIAATYLVDVFIRGRQDEGAIQSFTVSTTLVRGPDGMWYLDRGTLN